MKKRHVVIFLTMMIMLCLTFAACGKNKHEFKTEWSKDGEYHWHECVAKKHDDVSDKDKHKFDNGVITAAATLESEGVRTFTCTVCGYQKTETVAKLDPSHEHTFNTSVWEKDGDNHWHPATCEHTNEKGDFAPHAFDKEVVKEEYLASAATVADSAKYYKSCVCGLKGAETFNYGSSLNAADNEVKLSEGVTGFDKTYDGEPVSISADSFTANGAAITLQYKLKTAGDETYGNIAPKNAGAYVVKATSAATAEYKSATFECDFTISKKAIANVNFNAEYDGNDQMIIANSSGLLAASGVIAGDDVSLDIQFDGSVVGSTGFDIAEITGADKDNYDFTSAVLDCEIVARKLPLPASLNFTRNASDKKLNAVAKLTENVIEGDEVWLLNETDDIRYPAVYNFKASKLSLSDPNYEIAVDDNADVTLTVVNDEKFLMSITDVFAVSGQGIVLAGKIYSGEVAVGDELILSDSSKVVTVKKISINKINLTSAVKGQEIAILTDTIERSDVSRYQVVYKADEKSEYNAAEINFTFDSSSARRTPVTNNTPIRVEFYTLTALSGETDTASAAIIDGVAKFADPSTEMVIPGETGKMNVILYNNLPIEEDMFVVVMAKKSSGAYEYVGTGVISALNSHTHDQNYKNMGVCDECKYANPEIKTLAYNDADYYITTVDFEAGKSYYFKVTIRAFNAENDPDDLRWHLSVSCGYQIYEATVYLPSGETVDDSDLECNNIYYIRIDAKSNESGVEISVEDSDSM